jgi:hypothetical protein
MIATTINMHLDTLYVIAGVASKLKTTKRDIVVRLLMRIMQDIVMYPVRFSAVRYQADDRKRRWHCFSIKFRPDENEFFTDLRKLCKCSVSCLVAIAAEKYLDEILAASGKKVHNKVRFSNYVIRRIFAGGLICWQLYWGYPHQKMTPMIE